VTDDSHQIEVGTPEEATAAVARLLSVTQAAYERRAQLEHALHSRVAIEQAKGIVAERYGIGVEEAFDLIRRAARANRMKLHDLVRLIRPGEEMPPELATIITQGKNV
jgi:ANTAR domain-containing protein